VVKKLPQVPQGPGFHSRILKLFPLPAPSMFPLPKIRTAIVILPLVNLNCSKGPAKSRGPKTLLADTGNRPSDSHDRERAFFGGFLLKEN